MTDLTHYILVRRDIPLGVAMAQVAHAAGESFLRWGYERAPGQTVYDISRTKAVVLGVRNVDRLTRASLSLDDAKIEHVPIFEPESPYDGQLMAIGLLPTTEQRVAKIMARYQVLKGRDG